MSILLWKMNHTMMVIAVINISSTRTLYVTSGGVNVPKWNDELTDLVNLVLWVSIHVSIEGISIQCRHDTRNQLRETQY